MKLRTRSLMIGALAGTLIACVPTGRDGRRPDGDPLVRTRPGSDPMGGDQPPPTTPPPTNPPPTNPPPTNPPPTNPPPTNPPSMQAVLQNISVTPSKVMIPYGGTQSFVAVGNYDDGGTRDLTAMVTWSSADPSIATVDATGVATAGGSGEVLILARLDGVQGSASLTVGEAALVSVAVTPVNPSLAVGATVQLVVTGTYGMSDTRDVTQMATFTSSDPTKVTVSASGLVTAVADGAATITAAVEGMNATTEVTVSGCNYPTTNRGMRLGSVVENLSWTGIHDETGRQFDFSMQDFACGADYQQYNTAMVIVGTEWCPNCPNYFRRVSSQADQITAAGGLILYAEIENRSSSPSTSAEAQRAVNRIVGQAKGLRVGAAGRRIYNSPLVRVFPTSFVIRKSDMKIITSQSTSNSTLPFLRIAQNPEHDWSNGNLPPPFQSNCTTGQDETYEPNDTVAQAATLQAGASFSGGICTEQPDFYRIDIQGNWRIDLQFSHSTGDIDLYVWDEQRNDIARNSSNQKIGSNSNTDNERYDGSGPKLIYIHGYESASAPYTLTVSNR